MSARIVFLFICFHYMCARRFDLLRSHIRRHATACSMANWYLMDSNRIRFSFYSEIKEKENIKKQFEISDCFCLLVRATCVQRSGEFRFPSVAFESKCEFMRLLCGGRTAVKAQDLLIEYEKWIYFLRAKAENCVCLKAAQRHATPDNQKKQIHD